MRPVSRLLVWMMLWLFAGQSLLAQAAVAHQGLPQPASMTMSPRVDAATHHHHQGMLSAAATEAAMAAHPACGHDCHCVDAHCAAAAVALPRAALSVPAAHPADAPQALTRLARACAGYAGNLLRPPSFT